MPQLVIAEKPSVAQELAKVLGAHQKHKGYLSNEHWIITWALGHLVELCEPHEYNKSWKRWSMDTLPMIPQKFKLRPIKKTQEQLKIVSKLLKDKRIEAVINACDAGREGELIFRYIYELTKSRLPVKRLWISSMTEEAILKGFQELKPASHFERLWDAARSRSQADWLVGINGTRAMTLRVRTLNPSQELLLSIGRVQTPTLAILVQREKEILNFKPEDYWQIYALFHLDREKPNSYIGKWFKGKQDRFKDETSAQKLIEHLRGHTGIIDNIEKKIEKEKPPLLFDLTTLQRIANKRFGYSASKTLDIAQQLYEQHKLITYPRTDSSHLSEDMKSSMKFILKNIKIAPYALFIDELLQLHQLPMPKRIFDDRKVSDHHAIIPTPRNPISATLSVEEKKIYDLIARRFIAAFFPEAIYEKTKVITKILDETFLTKGKIVIESGWRRVLGFDDTPSSQKDKKRGKNEEDQAILPPLKKGMLAPVEKLDLKKKRTKPPARYTEATLLSAMEGAGKLLEEEELKRAMKDSGLGTPATRANIIETLIKRKYIQRQKKNLHPTDKGIQLIDNIPIQELISPKLTGEWESKMAQMARGEYPFERFEFEIRQFVEEMIQRIKAASWTPQTAPSSPTSTSSNATTASQRGPSAQYLAIPSFEERKVGICPECGGVVLEHQKVYACRGKEGRENGCGFRIFKTIASKKITPSMVNSLLTKGRTKLLKNFKSKRGHSFNAVLVLQPKGDVIFEFEKKNASQEPVRSPKSQAPSSKTILGRCPRCHQGEIIRGHRAWGCNRWKEGCQTIIPFTIEHRSFSEEEVQQLLEHSFIGPLDGFQREDGSTYSANVILVEGTEKTSISLQPITKK